MNHPHKSQAAAMERAGELTDGELSMSMFASRQDYDKAVAHQEAGEFPPLPIKAGAVFDDGYWNREKNGPLDLPRHQSVRCDFYTATQMRAYAQAARSEAMKETARYRADAERLREVLFGDNGALTRMDRARDWLTKGNPTRNCNWGVLDTSDLRAALAATQQGEQKP